VPPKPQPNFVLRTAVPEDSLACGQICYDAFSTISAAHGFPCDLPGPEAAVGALSMMFSTPGFYCLVAEYEGRIVGSNCLDERSVISGVGPITIDPGAQNLGIGRRLMRAVMDRASERGSAGIRLVQAGYHMRSLSLYAGLGFDIREPLACVQGRTSLQRIDGCVVRPAAHSDLSACNALCRRVHGFERGAELAQAIHQGTAKVVERGGSVTWYSTNLAIFGHATAETNLDLQSFDRVRGIVRWSGNPRALTEQRPVSLVPIERSATRPAYDVDERGTL
jgi:GNAT superfamily N-acetyltransferase